MDTTYELVVYEEDGAVPLARYLRKLRDMQAKTRILQAIQRMTGGNFGDHKSVGDGVWEQRIHYGPGYRVYYCEEGSRVVLLLCAGDKTTQDGDVKRAQAYKKSYEERQ